MLGYVCLLELWFPQDVLPSSGISGSYNKENISLFWEIKITVFTETYRQKNKIFSNNHTHRRTEGINQTNVLFTNRKININM